VAAVFERALGVSHGGAVCIRLDVLGRVYGPATWAVYDLLDESPATCGPGVLTKLSSRLPRYG
jgi:hypothetical protein